MTQITVENATLLDKPTTARRPRGRPPGSGKKQRSLNLLASLRSEQESHVMASCSNLCIAERDNVEGQRVQSVDEATEESIVAVQPYPDVEISQANDDMVNPCDEGNLENAAAVSQKVSRKRHKPVERSVVNRKKSAPKDNEHGARFRISDHRPLNRYVNRLGGRKWICSFGCRPNPYTGSYIRIRSHLVGLLNSESKSQAIPLCPKVSNSMREKMRKEEYEAHNVLLEKYREVYAPSVPISVPPAANVVPSVAENIGDQSETCREVKRLSDDEPRNFVSTAANHDNSSGQARSDAIHALNDEEAWIGDSINSFGWPNQDMPFLSLLSRLNQPRPHDPSQLSHEIIEECMDLVPQVKSLLVSKLLNASQVNQMVDIANNSFAYMDGLCVEYNSFYQAVHSYISCQNLCMSADAQNSGELGTRIVDAKRALLREI